MRTNIFETIVGAIVLLVSISFVIYAYQIAGPRAISGYQIYAQFDRVDGLALGADVRVSGIRVGSVSDMSLDNDVFGAKVTITLQNSVKLPEDTSARITSSGILGQAYVALEPGGAEENLTEGSEITITSGSVDLMSLISRVIFSLGGNENSSE